MISSHKYINQSLELNLFFLRMMKEHCIFLEAAFTIKDYNLLIEANTLKNEFTYLLSNTILLSDGVISSEALESNGIITEYTSDAERATQFATGISIDSNITAMESVLQPNTTGETPSTLIDSVYKLNYNSIKVTNKIINFKSKLKINVLSCGLFTSAYPLFIDHLLREGLLFAGLLSRLQNGTEIDIRTDILSQAYFWNSQMSDHAFFIRGLLDPTETELFNLANSFGNEFKMLAEITYSPNYSTINLSDLTNKILNETIAIRDFKAQCTEGLLACKIKSIILPLLADHLLRETNFFIYFFKSLQKKYL